MASSVDPMTQLQNGLVAAIDTATSIVAITLRASGNIIPWSADIGARLPVLTYFVSVLVPSVGGYTGQVTLSAWAERGDTAQQLLHEAIGALAQPLLYAVGCDAVVLDEIRREIPSEDRDDPARADVDLTVWLTPT